jgi:hypothetical protein
MLAGGLYNAQFPQIVFAPWHSQCFSLMKTTLHDESTLLTM